MQLPSVLTLPQAHGAAKALSLDLAALPRGSTATLDASALNELDSSALAVLLHAGREARAREITLQMRGAPSKLLELAALYGVAALLPPPDRA